MVLSSPSPGVAISHVEFTALVTGPGEPRALRASFKGCIEVLPGLRHGDKTYVQVVRGANEEGDDLPDKTKTRCGTLYMMTKALQTKAAAAGKQVEVEPFGRASAGLKSFRICDVFPEHRAGNDAQAVKRSQSQCIGFVGNRQLSVTVSVGRILGSKCARKFCFDASSLPEALTSKADVRIYYPTMFPKHGVTDTV